MIPLDWLLASQLEELPSPELTRYIARQIGRDGPGTVPTVDRRRLQRSLSHMSEALVRTSDFHGMDDGFSAPEFICMTYAYWLDCHFTDQQLARLPEPT